MHSDRFMNQKLNYIHHLTVAAGMVDKVKKYLYNNARDYYHEKKIGLIDFG